jgi:hypothetical protein
MTLQDYPGRMAQHSPKTGNEEPLHRRSKLVVKRKSDGSLAVSGEDDPERPSEEVAEQPEPPREDPRSALGRLPQHGV